MTEREDYEALLAAEHAERDARSDAIHASSKALLASRAATFFAGTRELINAASLGGSGTIPLSGTPQYPEATLVFINGVSVTYGSLFTVSGSNVVINPVYLFSNETDSTDYIEVIWR